jgi:hypothetical protein
VLVLVVAQHGASFTTNTKRSGNNGGESGGSWRDTN